MIIFLCIISAVLVVAMIADKDKDNKTSYFLTFAVCMFCALLLKFFGN